MKRFYTHVKQSTFYHSLSNTFTKMCTLITKLEIQKNQQMPFLKCSVLGMENLHLQYDSFQMGNGTNLFDNRK